jgi:hypothetical protein
MHIFHKWFYHNGYVINSLLNKEVKERFRQCCFCGKVQKFHYLGWVTLNKEETEIFKSKYLIWPFFETFYKKYYERTLRWWL